MPIVIFQRTVLHNNRMVKKNLISTVKYRFLFSVFKKLHTKKKKFIGKSRFMYIDQSSTLCCAEEGGGSGGKLPKMSE